MCLKAVAEQLPLLHLSMKEGLSSDYVYHIAHDSRGFMWVATGYGVCRYDGRSFISFLHDGGGGLPSNTDITELLIDPVSDRPWVSHRWHGVSRYEEERGDFISYDSDSDGLSSDYVYTIAVAPSGDLYAFTEAGVDIYDRDKDRFRALHTYAEIGLPSEYIREIVFHPSGDCFIAYPASGFAVWSPASDSVRTYVLPEGNKGITPYGANTFHIDDNGIIWIGSQGDISLFNVSTQKFMGVCEVKEGINNDNAAILSIYKDKTGKVWAGSRSRLYYFNATDFQKIVTGELPLQSMFVKDALRGVANPSVTTVVEDPFGNIWLGSNGGGVSMLDLSAKFFRNWRLKTIPGVTNGLEDKEVMTILQDKHGDLWMGTDGGGILVNHEGRNSICYSLANGHTTASAYNCSLADSHGRLWFNSFEVGIEIYDPDTGQFSHLSIPDYKGCVWCLYEDQAGDVLVGSDNGIIVYSRLSGKFSRVADTLNKMSVRSILQDRGGKYWIGTRGNGILQGDSLRGSFRQVGDELMRNYVVNQIFEDTKGNIWVASDEGLIMFNRNNESEYRRYGVEEGPGCERVCSLTEDDKGNIWMGTNFGISVLDPASGRFINYGIDDGVLPGPYMAASVCKSIDGMIYFGCLNGVCYFYPNVVVDTFSHPAVVFTKVIALGKGLSSPDCLLNIIDDKVIIKPGQDDFTVFFNIMNQALQSEVEYAYRLDGKSDDWINLGTTSEVTFRSLPYGTHTLYVSTRLRHGEWQDSVNQLRIVVEPPVWLSGWAKTVYILIFIVVVGSAGRIVIRHLKLKASLAMERIKNQKESELHEERLQFYSNLAHELRTPMTLILGPAEDLESSEDLSEDKRRKATVIRNNAIRLMDMVNRLLEFRKTEINKKRLHVSRCDISSYLNTVAERYVQFVRSKGLEYIVDITAVPQEVYVDQEVISMIVDNLISNAVKYTETGSVGLYVRTVIENGVKQVEIEVRDTGKGISEEDIGHIFDRYYRIDHSSTVSGFGIGLALVKNLVELHEGTLHVDSRPGEGSSFTVRLLTGNSYPEAEHVMIEKRNDGGKTGRDTVLVVEDEEEIRKYICSELADTYNVVEAVDGSEGIRRVMETMPSVVISDIMIPYKSGIELCREIKGHNATNHIPVILLTAKDDSRDKVEGYEAGADAYITKPFSISVLRSQVANLLKSRKSLVKIVAENPIVKRTLLTSSMDKLDGAFIEKFEKIVISNIGEEKLDVSVVADEMNMSYSSLYRKTKVLTGLSPVEFIRKVRLHEAERLLLSGKYSVSEITIKVGFSSMSYFRECFKKEFGNNPSQYVKEIESTHSVQPSDQSASPT